MLQSISNKDLINGIKVIYSTADIRLIQVKEEGWTGFSKGWQGWSEGFPEGKAQETSEKAALPARGKPRPSRLFYLDLHSI